MTKRLKLSGKMREISLKEEDQKHSMLTFFKLQELLKEQNPDHWLVSEDMIWSGDLAELVETGSVTLEIGSRRVVLAFQVEEDKS